VSFTNRSVKEQAKSGLHLGIGLGFFLIALMLLGSGLRRVVWSVPAHHPLVWSDWLGWLEIGLSLSLMIVTARFWLLLLGGWTVFAFVKSVAVLITGRSLSAPHGSFPRPEAAAIAALALATLALMVRFAESPPTILDRFGLTFFVLALLWNGNEAGFSAVGPAFGVAGLAICWFVYRWRKLHRRDDSVH
jgi:hypothetical protein